MVYKRQSSSHSFGLIIMGVIYLRTNLVNGMQYVGQTTNLPARKHNWKTLDKPYSNKVIDNDRIVFGLDNFSFEILKECDTKDELDEWERYYIKELNTRYPNGYNMCDGGRGCSGWVMPEEQRLKLSESRKGEGNGMHGKLPWNAGKKMNDDFCNAVSRGIKGKTKGIPKSEEHKRKIGLAHAVPIIQVNKNGEIVEWESANEVAKVLGYNFSHIRACCRGERHTAYGCEWYNKDEYEKMLGEFEAP